MGTKTASTEHNNNENMFPHGKFDNICAAKSGFGVWKISLS